jgi:hypothetical protein
LKFNFFYFKKRILPGGATALIVFPVPMAQGKCAKAAEAKLVIYDCTIEIWLGILVRKLLKRGNFVSVADLQEKILQFIGYYNVTMAKPFKWTYKGKVLCM